MRSFPAGSLEAPDKCVFVSLGLFGGDGADINADIRKTFWGCAMCVRKTSLCVVKLCGPDIF